MGDSKAKATSGDSGAVGASAGSAAADGGLASNKDASIGVSVSDVSVDSDLMEFFGR